mmetsp:Transcript_34780/g.98608  ORF Transcript_34780/g.98608 Transcript_34780/m.98608 type:complete len:321 (-) Transcript_34780:371-1333(-)
MRPVINRWHVLGRCQPVPAALVNPPALTPILPAGAASMGYGNAPWRFSGQALYQLQLVKVEEAQKYVPEGLKLVQAFGYTLGGFYLARYEDSPVGKFDELVVMGGLVWNPPTSCAWAARVYVNNRSARNHGVSCVGLPSRLGCFQETDTLSETATKKDWAGPSWWQQPILSLGLRGGSSQPAAQTGRNVPVTLHNVESRWGWPLGKRRGMRDPVASVSLPPARVPSQWPGPRIRVVLPSFSGLTAEHPSMLRYVCDLKTNVRPVSCARVLLENDSKPDDRASMAERHPESLHGVLSGKPLVAFAFDNMAMDVAAPAVVPI